MTIQAGEREQSAARDQGLSTPTDFIASPLHCVVLTLGLRADLIQVTNTLAAQWLLARLRPYK
jgi:hypothetical protein